MTRVSEFGIYSELSSERLLAERREPLSGIYPEAFELSLPQKTSLESLLHMLGYACLKHKALLEVSLRHPGPMPGATLSILTRQETFRALLVVRKDKVLFILPPSKQSALV